MTLRNYLIIMLAATIICWALFAAIVFMVNPEATSWIGFFLFYFSLFLSLVGTAAITGFVIRFFALKHELAWRSVKNAFRQSFLFALLIVIILFLLANNLFNWLNMVLLVIGLTVLEFFLLSYDRPRPATDNSIFSNNDDYAE